MTLEEQIEHARAHPESPNFAINPKQGELFYAVMQAAAGLNDYRIIAYGGGMRSGKTYGMLALLVILCKAYPGSRWIVVCETYGYAKKNTFPELLKIISPFSTWTINYSELSATFHNGSTIEFRSEDHVTYPTQTNFDGLSCSGMMLEECQNLSKQMFNKAQQRIGSLRLPKEPKPLLLMTFNPCSNWVKKEIYEPWVNYTLPRNTMFINALPKDNPTNTKEQMETWKAGDPHEYARYVEGNWADLDVDSRWAYAFDRTKHVGECVKRDDLDLWIGFDFNRSPMCAVVAQHDEAKRHLYIIEAIKLPGSSDIYKMCDYILANYKGHSCVITGDASGHNSSALVSDGLNYYKVIMAKLMINRHNLVVPRANPPLKENQMLVNTLFAHYDITIDAVKGAALIWDCENVKMNADGTIVKLDRSDPAQQADILDAYRYIVNSFCRRLVKNIIHTL